MIKKYLNQKTIFLGGVVKFAINKVLHEGDISPAAHETFFDAAHQYFKISLDYILTKVPLNYKLITTARWINVPERINVVWENVKYFRNRYQPIFKEFSTEFCNYQYLRMQKLVRMLRKLQKLLMMQLKRIVQKLLILLIFSRGILER